jgi:hypothetical protein
MGLLDDAIREHLDLKRRRGADPDEVARQEQEALGPPRTGRFAGEGEEPVFAEEARADDDLTAEDTAERPGAVAAGFADEADEGPWPDERHEAVLEDRREAVLEDRRDALEPPPDQPTSEFTPPGVREPAQETPDFLQETPEHDRLWFEQRPPRDFDFDK